MDISIYKEKALEILSPIKPADNNTFSESDFEFKSIRSDAGRNLSSYYLVFFLFHELLNYRTYGPFEKTAWSIPIDYLGRKYLIEHRKFGIGVFIYNKSDEKDATVIVNKINTAIKKITPYFNYLAQVAIKKSELNITNKNKILFDRYKYLLSLYNEQLENYEKSRKEVEDPLVKIITGESVKKPWFNSEYKTKANWLCISCTEAFFSWTEHLFIHLAVIVQQESNGEEIAKLINEEWKNKFLKAIPLDSNKEVNRIYNDLIIIRKQLRNFVAHGAFGKDGHAFQFHSKAGAVPVLLNNSNRNKFSLVGSLTFNNENVISVMEEFIKFLYNSNYKIAMYYTQERSLPTILTFAKNGKYKKAMMRMENMEKLSEYLIHEIETSMNMDF